MKNKKLISLIATATIVGSFVMPSLASYADGLNVVSIGANLTNAQKQEMISYFNAKEGSYKEITINNNEEQQDLKGIVPESEIGDKTISCAYVEPTNSGGINVKTANLDYVTASMISNALTTAGIYNANVIAAAPFKVSGTGALTGIINAFEKSSGQAISPERKQLANKEIELTGKIAEKAGTVKASALVNGVKSEVIDSGLTDNSKIEKIINEEAKEYGVTLTTDQTKELIALMAQIGNQKYNKEKIEDTLDKIEESLNKTLDNEGQLNGTMNKLDVHVDSFIGWFKDIFGESEVKQAGIVNETNNNSTIGKTAVVTGSSSAVEGAKVDVPVKASTKEVKKVEPKASVKQQVEVTPETKGNSELNTENLRIAQDNIAKSIITFLHESNDKAMTNAEKLQKELVTYLGQTATVEKISKAASTPLTNDNLKYAKFGAIVTKAGGYETGYIIDMGKVDPAFKGKVAQVDIRVITPGKPINKPVIKAVDGKITGDEFCQEVWYSVYKFVKDNPATANQYQTDHNLMEAIKQSLPKSDILGIYTAPYPADLNISCNYSDAIGRKQLFISTDEFLPMAKLPQHSANLMVSVMHNGKVFEPFVGA